MVLDFVTAGAFAIACLIVYTVGMLLSRMRKPVQQLAGLGVAIPGDVSVAGSRLAPQLPHAPDDRGDALDLELSRAGWYKANARARFLSFRGALVIYSSLATSAACFVIAIEDFTLGGQVAVAGGAIAIMIWALPRLYLRSIAQQRVKRIRRAIPDALDLLTMCLSGGLPLNRAFRYVTEEVSAAHPDLATEFTIVQRHTEMRSLDFAFRQFAKRIDVPEVQSLSALITQGQRLGTDIATAIRDYADNTRLWRRQTADERANKASVKMLFPLTLCLLPSVFMILWGPSVLELWTFLQSFQGASSGR
ncbi:MAG: type II secretion system F family protein [Planctomycetota bacterium]